MGKICKACYVEKPPEEFPKEKHGVDGLRSICKPCNVKRVKEHNAKNRSAFLARKSAYRQANPEKIKESNARRNKSDMRASARAYALSNQDRRRASQANRRARKLKATPLWYGELDEFVVREAAALCQLRKKSTGIEWQVDHMLPLRAREVCGLHVGINLQVIPAAINQHKKDRMMLTLPGEWVRYGQ